MALAGKTKQDVVSEFRSAEILGAARKVFALKGFSDATMDEIAAAAGIAKGTIYLYFPTKRDIYLAALKEGLTELRERTNRNMEVVRGIRSKLRSFITARIEYAEANRDFIRIYQSEFGNLTKAPLYDSEFQQLYLQQAEDLKAVLQAAVENGEIRNIQTEFMAFMIYDMVKGVMVQRLLEWSHRGMEEDIQLVDDLLWKGLAPV
jgi:AcrR family transcriptional regulator